MFLKNCTWTVLLFECFFYRRCDQRVCNSTVWTEAVSMFACGLAFLVFILLGEVWCCDQSTNAAPRDPSLYLTPPDLSLFVTMPGLSGCLTSMAEEVCGLGESISTSQTFFCTETGSPTHTDTLLLNRSHFSLVANTSSPPSCCPQSQSQLFP